MARLDWRKSSPALRDPPGRRVEPPLEWGTATTLILVISLALWIFVVIVVLRSMDNG